jgi:hypothetical protein
LQVRTKVFFGKLAALREGKTAIPEPLPFGFAASVLAGVITSNWNDLDQLWYRNTSFDRNSLRHNAGHFSFDKFSRK